MFEKIYNQNNRVYHVLAYTLVMTLFYSAISFTFFINKQHHLTNYEQHTIAQRINQNINNINSASHYITKKIENCSSIEQLRKKLDEQLYNITRLMDIPPFETIFFQSLENSKLTVNRLGKSTSVIVPNKIKRLLRSSPKEAIFYSDEQYLWVVRSASTLNMKGYIYIKIPLKELSYNHKDNMFSYDNIIISHKNVHKSVSLSNQDKTNIFKISNGFKLNNEMYEEAWEIPSVNLILIFKNLKESYISIFLKNYVFNIILFFMLTLMSFIISLKINKHFNLRIIKKLENLEHICKSQEKISKQLEAENLIKTKIIREIQEADRHKAELYRSIISRQQELLLDNIASSRIVLDNFENNNLTTNELITLIGRIYQQSYDLEQGLMPLKSNERTQINSLIQDILNIFKGDITLKNITLIKSYESQHLIYQGDEIALKVLFYNIFKRSIYRLKKNGHLNIELSKSQRSFHLRVSDDGFVIENTDLDRWSSKDSLSLLNLNKKQIDSLSNTLRIALHESTNSHMNIYDFNIPIRPQNQSSTQLPTFDSNIVQLSIVKSKKIKPKTVIRVEGNNVENIDSNNFTI